MGEARDAGGGRRGVAAQLPDVITAVPAAPVRPLLSVLTSSGERLVPLSVKLRAAAMPAAPSDRLIVAADNAENGDGVAHDRDGNALVAPLLSAAPPRTLFVPVTVTAPV